MWLSLICTNCRSPRPHARWRRARVAPSGMPFSTPPYIVHTAPVPTHAMHCRNPRRSISLSSSFFATPASFITVKVSPDMNMTARDSATARNSTPATTGCARTPEEPGAHRTTIWPGHPWMNRAVVLEGARDIERVGELFVGVEHRRLECPLGTHDVVRDIVVVRPRDRRPDRDGGRGRREAEVVHHHLRAAAGAASSSPSACRRPTCRSTRWPPRSTSLLYRPRPCTAGTCVDGMLVPLRSSPHTPPHSEPRKFAPHTRTAPK